MECATTLDGGSATTTPSAPNPGTTQGADAGIPPRTMINVPTHIFLRGRGATEERARMMIDDANSVLNPIGINLQPQFRATPSGAPPTERLDMVSGTDSARAARAEVAQRDLLARYRSTLDNDQSIQHPRSSNRRGGYQTFRGIFLVIVDDTAGRIPASSGLSREGGIAPIPGSEPQLADTRGAIISTSRLWQPRNPSGGRFMHPGRLGLHEIAHLLGLRDTSGNADLLSFHTVRADGTAWLLGGEPGVRLDDSNVGRSPDSENLRTHARAASE